MTTAAWRFATAGAVSEPVYITGKEWYAVDPIAKTGYRLAAQGSVVGGLAVYGMGWTRFGPVLWAGDPYHVPFACKIVVSTEKLRLLPSGDVFRAEALPATMPAK